MTNAKRLRATGDWNVSASDHAVYLLRPDQAAAKIKETRDRWVANAKLIAAGVNALPELLDRVEKLEAALRGYVEAAHHQDGCPGCSQARALLATPVETRGGRSHERV